MMRPPRTCGHPMCTEPTTGYYCTRHQRPSIPREKTKDRGYGGTWRKLRRLHLRWEPMCRVCGEPATDVDHIVPLAAGGTNEDGNLQSLCHRCHSRKTGRERAGGGG